MSERIEKFVTELTLDEKAALTAGVDLWHGPGADRLGIPALEHGFRSGAVLDASQRVGRCCRREFFIFFRHGSSL